ncbi:unnamed protein product [Orchesella dallaii]|uniref:Uncharacterized protein n=1 Tax=Orchesella dallaii TaxID=48710 RepID=A0ABP1RVA5_9HEXA
MDPFASNVTHNCERYCKMPCSDFTMNSPLYKDCTAAVDHCKCRPIWKDPAFWLIFGLCFAVLVTVVRFTYIYVKEKKEKKAASGVANTSQDTKTSETTGTTTMATNSESTSTQNDLTEPQTQAIVVESSIVEQHL